MNPSLQHSNKPLILKIDRRRHVHTTHALGGRGKLFFGDAWGVPPNTGMHENENEYIEPAGEHHHPTSRTITPSLSKFPRAQHTSPLSKRNTAIGKVQHKPPTEHRFGTRTPKNNYPKLKNHGLRLVIFCARATTGRACARG